MDYRQYLSEIGAKGGNAGTKAQKLARAGNLAKVNAARKKKAAKAAK